MPEPDALAKLLAALSEPARDCSQAPFWFWNGPLDPDTMRRQVREMAAQGVSAAMPHPRFGMDRRAYLEPPFWAAMDATVAEAAAGGSQILLYDEYNWPSGAAGARVTDGRPDLYPHGLDYAWREAAGPGPAVLAGFAAGEPESGEFEHVVAAFREEGGVCRPWGRIAADGQSVAGELAPGPQRLLVFFQARAHDPSPLDPGSNAFVDYLNPETAQRFLALTHDAYAARYQAHFGRTIPAIFTDEPSAISAGPFPWTGDFAAEFQRRRAYDLLPLLPALLDAAGPDGWQHRAAYWQTVAELFSERFLGALSAWCRAHGIALTGHLFDEYLANWGAAPHQMLWLRHFDWPGMDALGPHARPAGSKIPASVAHLEQRPHFLCEALGLAHGWAATLGMAKRGYQFLAAMGVDVFVPHAFFQTVDNPRVECPPSYFDHNPYWPQYHCLASLTDRLCAFNRQGSHLAPVAVYYPIETVWAESTGGRGQGGKPWQVNGRGSAQAQATVAAFENLLDRLSAGPWDLDVVDAQALRQARLTPGGELAIGPESFACLILPETQTLPPELLPRLDAFLRAGGTLIALGILPARCYPPAPGAAPAATLAAWCGGVPQTPGSWPVGRGRFVWAADLAAVESALAAGVPPVIVYPGGRPAGLLCLARRSADATLWLLVNDAPEELALDLELPAARLPGGNASGLSLTLLRPASGAREGLAATAGAAGLRTRVQLGHTESLILIAGRGPALPVPPPPPPCPRVLALTAWEFQPFGEGEWAELPAWRLRERGWKAWRGWEQPGFDDHDWPLVAALRGEAKNQAQCALLRAVLPPGTTHLRLPLPVTGEYQLFVNGQLVERRLGPPPPPGELAIAHLCRGVGDTIAIEVASESDLSGLDAPLQLRGRAQPVAALRPWSDWGFDWFSGRAVYRCTVPLEQAPARARLDLGAVGEAAEVRVNGQLAAHLPWAPFQAEIGALLRAGENRLEVVVANTLANRFAWDRWSASRTGASWGVPPRPGPAGLLGPCRLALD